MRNSVIGPKLFDLRLNQQVLRVYNSEYHSYLYDRNLNKREISHDNLRAKEKHT